MILYFNKTAEFLHFNMENKITIEFPVLSTHDC